MSTAIPAEALGLTLDDAVRDLIDAYENAGRSPHTVLLFRTQVERLAAFLAADGVTRLDEVTSSMVTRFLAVERRRGLKPASLSISLRTLRRFFQFNVEQGNLTTNPARSVMSPTVTVEPVRFVDDAQITTLLASIASDRTVEGTRDTAFMRVLMDTGLRRGEIVGLEVADVSDDHRLVTVRGVTSKTRRGRTVPVGKDTARALRTWMRVREAYEARRSIRSGDALWVGPKGATTANGALQMLHRRLAAAGFPQVSLHSFRHHMAARAVERGLPMPYLVRIGGWANATMPTTRYGQYAIEERALSAMQTLLDSCPILSANGTERPVRSRSPCPTSRTPGGGRRPSGPG